MSKQPKETPVQPFLSGFKLVAVEKGITSKGDPLVIARTNVIDAAKLQRQAVQDVLDGKTLPSTTFTNKKGQQRSRGFVKWWHQKGGAIFSQIRYGQQSVFMDGDKPQAIEVGKELKDLLPFYDGLMAAIERGELDDRLAPLQAKTSARLKGRKKRAA